MSEKNSERFLNCFDEIERYLRKVTKEPKWKSFYELVEKASQSIPVVKHYKDDLKEFADLRNAIVHERTDGHVIAEPNDMSVEKLCEIAKNLLDPPKVIPLFQKEVYKVDAAEPIAKAIELMYKKSFSQIPVYKGKDCIGLLTSDTIVRWLGASVEGEIISLEDTLVSMVFKEYTEDKDNYLFLKRNATLFEVIKHFQDYAAKGKKVDAILITENGKGNESLLGIITAWDLSKVYEIINVNS